MRSLLQPFYKITLRLTRRTTTSLQINFNLTRIQEALALIS